MVVLKRLGDALRDGDQVLAVVRGSAVNQDGRSNGLMAPNPAAQMAVLRSAYANAGVSPRDVDFVEAHGTGTLLGDPIEARALGTVLGRGRGVEQPLLLGAVKSNLGHLEAAAGIAGFLKAVLAVQRGRIPANLGFDKPNPHIPFDDLRLKVVAEPMDWPGVDRPRRAGVSSFGFGGTNAHVVIEQAPAADGVLAPQAAPAVSTLVISGKSEARIASMAAVMAQWMVGAGSAVALTDIAHTLAHHRTRHATFATVCARDRDQAVAGLTALAAGRAAPGVVGPRTGGQPGGVVFVYSGQGSQWAGMGRALLADEPVFAAAVAELEPVFVAQTGFSLQQVLACGQPVAGIDRIQPVLVGMQLALTALWRSYGVTPDAVIGHSMGEVTAAVVAGALTPAEGLRVIATRSKLMSRLSGQGAMALLELDAAATQAVIADYPGVGLAVYASPRQTVIAGTPEHIDAVIAAVAARDRLARRIEVDVASHHPTIDPILPELRTALADLDPQQPTIPILTTTIETTQHTPTFDADYWAANLRNPVRFSQAITTATTTNNTYIEISPHPLLTHAITDTLQQHPDTPFQTLPTLTRDTDETITFHTNLNAITTYRPAHTPHPSGPRPILPAMPWHHTRHWAKGGNRRSDAGSAPRSGTLLGGRIAVATAPTTHLWQARLVPEAKPYPGHHRIHGIEVVPVSVLLHTLSAAATECGASGLSDIRFDHPIVVDQPRIVQVIADDSTVSLASMPADATGDTRWVTHASAHLANGPAAAAAPRNDTWRETSWHEFALSAGLQNRWEVDGQAFPWSIASCRTGSAGLRAEIDQPERSAVALLDAATQIGRLAGISDDRLMVPAAVESLRIDSGAADSRGVVEVFQREGGEDELVVDIVVTGFDGTTCVDIRSLRFTSLESAAPIPHAGQDPRTFVQTIEWRRVDRRPRPAEHPSVGQTLAVVGAGAAALRLRDGLSAVGHRSADISEARIVVYLPEPGNDCQDSDFDYSVRRSAEVGHLVRRLSERDEHHPATLFIITEGVREAATDAALRQSHLWGLAGVIGAEHPQLWGGLVDVASGGDTDGDVAALSALFEDPAKAIVALRHGELFAPALAPVSGEPTRDRLRCRPDAAYLITGGLGTLGLLMAGWLADRGARRLLLAARTPLPPRRAWDSASLEPETLRRIAGISALELRGVTVDAVCLDVGSGEALQGLLERRDREGQAPVCGVIHAAGVTDSQLLTDMTETRLARTMWSKIAGASALHRAFPPGSLDFFYLTASAGTVFGVPGQGAYAAANAYLDCLARARHRHGCHTVSLDWTAWQGLGFAADADVVVEELRRAGSRPVTPEEAFAAWDHVNRYDAPQVVIAPTSETAPAIDASQGQAPVRAWSEMTSQDVRAELEHALTAILAGELGVQDHELAVDRPFAELGLNSVMAMTIRREAEQLLGVELSVTMLWNHPTIASLADYLTGKLAPEDVAAQPIDAIPDDGDGLLESLFDSVESA